ncbi:threonine-phosphate decarboxylase CobD [Mesorhizobium sp. BR1-1-16]|uniref:threonine-phosphate decarboxylase CobD n=1 Tax=Mesorhizobium sp. BR1-1-16 TaxID=2876653 RepID=UPI001CCCDA59|nr:threonine-phosphate decarboxylase CobD [Mesorhizobium sp. BR1-1-16]MBZ9935494.1 threonine-phosphate decarboxylase CobD [Mesorhizobium sp. BR1-1-16]
MFRNDDAPRHGGGLAAAAARYGIAIEEWLDFSTGINPLPYPVAPLELSGATRLPDPAALAGLIKTARTAYAVSAAARIVPVPGSDLGLRLLPLLVPAARVAILAPTYSGHAEAWSMAGHQAVAAASLEAAAGADVIVLANPNNPDGRCHDPAALRAAAAALPPHGLLVVDEAFGDLEPALSLAGALDDPRLVVLRSFGKFYGLAGLRLGFVLGSGMAVRRLEGIVGDWPLSGAAITIGTAALADLGWQEAARQSLAERRCKLDDLLARHGLSVAGGTDLFRLVRADDSATLHRELARLGIWTRIFADLPGTIRFGLPPDSGFERLDEALRSLRRRGRS